MRPALTPLGSLFFVALAGCTNIITSTEIKSEKDPGGEPIAVYSLPRGLIQVEGKFEGAGADKKLKVTVSEVIIPDTRTRFRVDYGRSWFSADAVKINTTKGLLSTVSANADDRTSEAIVNLARSIGAAQGFTLPVGGTAVPASDDDEPIEVLKRKSVCVPTTDEFLVVVDPHKDIDPTKPNNGLPLWLSIEPMSHKDEGLTAENLVGDWGAPSDAQRKACREGLCTRSARPVRVRINERCGDKPAWQDKIVYLPDESQFTPVRLERSSFADKCFGVAFDHGMISEVRLRNASSAENLARLPEDIIRALVSVPTELIQLRFNYSVAQRDLTAAEQSRLQAEKAMQEFLRAVGSSSGGPGQGPSPSTPVKAGAPGAIGGAPALSEADCNLAKPG